MADEVTPIVETVLNDTPAPVIEVVPEVITPAVETANPAEASVEPTLNSVETESGATAQTLNPAEVGTGATLNSVKTESGELGGNEPLVSESKPIETVVSNPPLPDPKGLGVDPMLVVPVAPRSGMRELLVKARDAIAFRKRKKLDQVMGLLAKRTGVTNDDVEKLLHVSDATATRYLSILEKEGKIKQTGKGKGVLYVKN